MGAIFWFMAIHISRTWIVNWWILWRIDRMFSFRILYAVHHLPSLQSANDQFFSYYFTQLLSNNKLEEEHKIICLCSPSMAHHVHATKRTSRSCDYQPGIFNYPSCEEAEVSQSLTSNFSKPVFHLTFFLCRNEPLKLHDELTKLMNDPLTKRLIKQTTNSFDHSVALNCFLIHCTKDYWISLTKAKKSECICGAHLKVSSNVYLAESNMNGQFPHNHFHVTSRYWWIEMLSSSNLYTPI